MANNKPVMPDKTSPGPQPILTLALMLGATEQGLTASQVALQNNVAIQSVYNTASKMKRHGVKLKHDASGPKGGASLAVAFELGRLHEGGKGSLGSIAEKFSISPQRVGQIRKEAIELGMEL